MKLTSTNRSIDLIVPITNAHLYLPMQLVQKVEQLFGRRRKQINPSFSNLLFADLVVMAG